MRLFTEKFLGMAVKTIKAFLLVGAGLGSVSVSAATITANVDANITGGISGTASTGLSFGDISPGTSPGYVTVTLSGFRTAVGGVTLGLSKPANPAIFQVTGSPSSTYSITSPLAVYLTDGSGNYMMVNKFTSNPAGTGGLLDSGGTQTLTVGGTLHVGANQPGGAYYGVLAMTIVYY